MKIEIDIDLEQIARNTGRIFEDKEDIYYFLERCLSYLTTHNKNYTMEQYIKIEEINEIIKASYIEDFIIPF